MTHTHTHIHKQRQIANQWVNEAAIITKKHKKTNKKQWKIDCSARRA